MNNQDIYNENWKQWEESKIIGPMSRHTRRLVVSECIKQPFTSILDIGCGPGAFLSDVAKKFPAVGMTGIDISDAAIELARKRVSKAHYAVHDITMAPYPGKFDCVTMVDVAEHLAEDVAAFRNILSCCSGRLIIATLEGRMRAFEPMVGHVRNYKPGELAAKLHDAGFEVISYKRWGWPMYSPLYRNLTTKVDAHRGTIGTLERIIASLAYLLLCFTVPGRGDLVIAGAQPA